MMYLKKSVRVTCLDFLILLDLRRQLQPTIDIFAEINHAKTQIEKESKRSEWLICD